MKKKKKTVCFHSGRRNSGISPVLADVIQVVVHVHHLDFCPLAQGKLECLDGFRRDRHLRYETESEETGYVDMSNTFAGGRTTAPPVVHTVAFTTGRKRCSPFRTRCRFTQARDLDKIPRAQEGRTHKTTATYKERRMRGANTSSCLERVVSFRRIVVPLPTRSNYGCFHFCVPAARGDKKANAAGRLAGNRRPNGTREPAAVQGAWPRRLNRVRSLHQVQLQHRPQVLPRAAQHSRRERK